MMLRVSQPIDAGDTSMSVWKAVQGKVSLELVKSTRVDSAR